MEGKMKSSLLGVALLALSASAASNTDIMTERLANGTNDYVYVVADGGLGYEPGSREAVAAAVNAGADIVVLRVRKTADGKIMTNERTSLSQALMAMGDRALAMIEGFEEFPQELVNAYRKSRGGTGLILNSQQPLAKLRKRVFPAGLTDQTVHGIYSPLGYDRLGLYVPTVLADLSNISAAPDLHYLRVAEARVQDPKNLSALTRIRRLKSGTKLMLDTTADDRCAGHGDAHAVVAPEKHWGWCLEQGAKVIRTGRPAELCRYLEKLGRRDLFKHGPVIPYAAEAGAQLTLTPAVVPAPREMTVGKGLVPVGTKIEAKRDTTLPKEGYRLEVGPSGIEIAAADDDGEYWAHRTLEQLRGEVNGAAYYPVVSIRDWPQFAWRGAMMDSARHFHGKEDVKRFIDALSLHKLNVFHWHADDDQGWRLPLKGFPDLLKYGSASVEKDGSLYGPYFYTEEDVKEIVAFAKSRHVKIVPEFELPAHCRALVCSYPEVGCVSTRPEKGHPKRGGYGTSTYDETLQPNVICAGDDEAIKTVERMLDALCDMFPDSDTIHLGGDEMNKTWWKKCPNCQARIKALGLKGVGELQSWLMRHFAKHLADRGRKAIGWDEVMDGGTPEGMQVMFWRGIHRRDLASTSNRVETVSCSSLFCYFDKEQLIPNDPFHAWALCRLPKAYAYDPYDRIAPEFQRYVLGMEGLLWGGNIKTAEEVFWKGYPRLCATAEIAWTYPPKPRDYDGFLRRLGTHIPRLRALGIGSAHTPERIPDDGSGKRR